MGAGIAATNAPALADRIRDVRAVLDAWLDDLERPDGPDERGDRGPPARGPGPPRARSTDGRAGPRRPEDVACRTRRAGTASGPTVSPAFAGLVATRGPPTSRGPRWKWIPARSRSSRTSSCATARATSSCSGPRAGGDARLHDRYSIGVGGHLNPGDEGLDGGLRREWAEEVVADFVPEFELIALLNDDTTEVGAVHLGAVYVADAAGRAVTIRETDKLTGSFVEPTSRRGGRRPARDVEPARVRVPPGEARPGRFAPARGARR